MLLILFVAMIVVASLWWLAGHRKLSRNEQQYLKSRGYAAGEAAPPPAPLSADSRLFNLIASLSDLSPLSRQRAAEDLLRLCASGNGDPRMTSALTTALEDSDAGVRATVARALGHLADPRALEPLRRRLAEEESIRARSSIEMAIANLESANSQAESRTPD